jgi:hypothetical protein
VDEIAWRCEQCGQGSLLDSAHGLSPIEMHFASGIAPNAQGRPFWVAEGRVAVQRETYKGNQSQEAQAFWSQPRRFFVPAFTCPLETLIEQGVRFLRQPPALAPGSPAPFLPVTLAPENVNDMAEFIIVGTEADRKDKLRSVHVSLALETPELWILP